MKLRWAAACLGAVMCLLAACDRVNHNAQASMRYTLTPAPGEGWRVRGQFDGLVRGKPRLRLLAAWGAFENLGASIREVRITDSRGQEIPVIHGRDGRFAVWETQRKVSGTLNVEYLVRSYHPYSSPEASYVDESRGLALGYCVFLAPDEVSDYLPAPIQVSIPTEDPVWTSWGYESGREPETLHDLWSGVVVTGDFEELAMSRDGARVRVLTDPSWSGSLGLSLVNRLLPVLAEMHDLFEGAPRGDELEVLALFRTAPVSETRSFMIGVSEERSFLALATPDRYQDLHGVTALATHECLHFYLGGALTAEAEPPFQNNPDLIWFFEGMTEYLSYKLMHRAGVLGDKDWLRFRLEKAEKIERRALADMRLSDAARMYHWPEVYELIYNKGYFLAEYLDAYMADSCGPEALENAVRELFQEYNFYKTHRHLDQETLLDTFERHCAGSQEWIRTYIIGNKPLSRDGWAGVKKAAPVGAAYTR